MFEEKSKVEKCCAIEFCNRIMASINKHVKVPWIFTYYSKSDLLGAVGNREKVLL